MCTRCVLNSSYHVRLNWYQIKEDIWILIKYIIIHSCNRKLYFFILFLLCVFLFLYVYTESLLEISKQKLLLSLTSTDLFADKVSKREWLSILYYLTIHLELELTYIYWIRRISIRNIWSRQYNYYYYIATCMIIKSLEVVRISFCYYRQLILTVKTLRKIPMY